MNISTPPRDSAFLLHVTTALHAFQMIEEALKIIIGLSYEIIQASAPEPVQFRFDPKEVNNAALGTLKRMYGRVSKNESAAKRIGEIAPWRDYCAHRAFHVEFMSRSHESFSPEKDREGLRTVTQATVDLLQVLGNEIRTLRQRHSELIPGDSLEADAQPFAQAEGLRPPLS